MRTRLTAKAHTRLLIALAIVLAGVVSLSLSWLGKWTGVREPVQLGRSDHGALGPDK